MKKKQTQLGMNPSTASNRLVKDLLWNFVETTGKSACCKCGDPMSRETFSIEHVTPWLDSDNPVDLYFDVSNISYSHKVCNFSDARKTKSSKCGTHAKYTNGCRCSSCTQASTDYARSRYTSEARRAKYLREKAKVS